MLKSAMMILGAAVVIVASAMVLGFFILPRFVRTVIAIFLVLLILNMTGYIHPDKWTLENASYSETTR